MSRRRLIPGLILAALLLAGGIVAYRTFRTGPNPVLAPVSDLGKTRTGAEQPASPEPDKPDDAVVELELPAGASVHLNGADLRQERRATFRGLTPARLKRQTLDIEFAPGEREEHTLLLRRASTCGSPGTSGQE